MSRWNLDAPQGLNARGHRKALQGLNARGHRKALQDLNARGDRNRRQAKNVRRWTKRRSKTKKIAAIFFAAIAFFCLNSCQSLKGAAAPIAVFDARVCECPPESGWQGLGVEFVAVNLCGRPVQRAAFFASVAAKEEDIGDGAFSEASWTLENGLDAGEERTVFIPLEGLDDSVETDDLEIECVRVESAVFEEGELWPRCN